MGNAAASPLAEAMNRLWAKHQPQMEVRAAILRTAAAHLASGMLTEDEQQQAAAEAHKLAGVLGTFGLTEGTDLAREAEDLLGASPVNNSGMRLSMIAERLRAIVATRSRAS